MHSNMHPIGRFATRSVRYTRYIVAIAGERVKRLRTRSGWLSLSTRERYFFAVPSVRSACAIALTSAALVRAETADDASTISKKPRGSASRGGNEDGSENVVHEEQDTPVAAHRLGTVMGIIDPIARLFVTSIKEKTDPASRTVAYGIVGTNVAVSSAFVLGFFLNKPPKPKPALLRFMFKNFVLSQGWLKRGRWHVLFSSTFTHLSAKHLTINSLFTCLGVLGCAQFLTAPQIAWLYLSGGLLGGSASVSLCALLRKRRYMTVHIGGSDGVYALAFFWAFASSAKDAPPLLLHQEILQGLLVFSFLTNIVGFRKFLEYGYTGKGENKIILDYTAHLVGALTGVAAYGLTRISRRSTRHVDVTETPD